MLDDEDDIPADALSAVAACVSKTQAAREAGGLDNQFGSFFVNDDLHVDVRLLGDRADVFVQRAPPEHSPSPAVVGHERVERQKSSKTPEPEYR